MKDLWELVDCKLTVALCVILKQDVRNYFNKHLVFWIPFMAPTGSLDLEKVESLRSLTALFTFSSCLPTV